MKTPTLISIALIQFALVTEGVSQLVAEAGNDTALCDSENLVLIIGGDPTASGGVPPYQYAWSGSFEYVGNTYTASYMLEDTTVANPVFKDGTIPDSILLFVTVKDSQENTSLDSIMVRLSGYTFCLGECRFEINEGDSVQLGHCVTGGIPPLSFLWEPAETLSDGSVEAPWAKPSVSATYTLQISDAIGCPISSHCDVHVIPAGIDQKNQTPALELQLDASQKILHVKILQELSPNTIFELIDMNGSVVERTYIDSGFLTISIRHLERGLYVYRLTSGQVNIASGKVLL